MNIKDFFGLSGNIRRPVVIAGPCSAESEEQTLTTARELHDTGIEIFRAGIWKPRTKPGHFEGVGSKGLEWLQKVKQETGMLVATEVANREHTIAALHAGIDILWVGARTTTNPFAVQEIADTLQEIGKDVIVLVKNPVNPDIELWIGAIERMRNAGIRRIAAVHRGFSVYGNHVYRNYPQWDIPIELHRRVSDIPMFHDPSHTGGKRDMIGFLSQQAMDMEFDGLIIESHCSPDSALSDSAQQITPSQLGKILSSLIIRGNDSSSNSELSFLRHKVDNIDENIIELLARRIEVCRQIGHYKLENEISVVQNDRYKRLIESRVTQASELGLSENFIRKILETIHAESVRNQIEILNDRHT